MLRSILWKEWRECRWKMLTLFAVYLLLVLLAWAWDRRAPWDMVQYVIIAMAFIIPGVIAMGVIADERVRHTAETLQALPVSMRRVFVLKSLAGLATVLLPLLAVELFCILAIPWDHYRKDFFYRYCIDVLSFSGLTVSLYLWILALAARCRTELGVGAIYLSIYLGMAAAATLFYMIAMSIRGGLEPDDKFWNAGGLLYSLGPLGFTAGFGENNRELQPHLGLTPVFQILTWIPLWSIALLRYGRTPAARIARSPDQAVTAVKAAAPLRPRRFPIIWKSWRESRFLVLSYAIAVLAIITPVSLEVQHCLNEGRFYGGVDTLVVYPGILSMLMVILLGTDIGLREAESRLEFFWHSRPIPQATYFRRCFAFGLAMAFLLAVVPAVLTLAITHWQLATTKPPPLNLAPAWAAGRPPEWPPARDGASVSNMLNQIRSAGEQSCIFLLVFTPHAVLFFTLSTFLATLARRRIIPLIASFGCAMALELMFNEHNLAAKFALNAFYFGLPAFGARLLVYWAIPLAASTVLACLAIKSTTAHWRDWLQRKAESSWSLAGT